MYVVMKQVFSISCSHFQFKGGIMAEENHSMVTINCLHLVLEELVEQQAEMDCIG